VRLVDSHAHLQVPRFAHDADAVLAAAQQAGVERLLDPGWDLASSEAALGLARRYPWIDAAAGVHPHDATGLDYDRLFSPGEVQLAGLRRHLELALALGKPLILHCRSARAERDAQDDLVRELRDAGFGGHDWRDRFRGRVPAVLHSFSGPIDYAEEALALGLAISISGLAFRRREESTAEVARLVPADRLLVETDSPYLPPPGADRRRNEPRWVGITAAWLAEQRSEDPGLLGERLVANYDRVFRGELSSRRPRKASRSSLRRR
jgi:TatD DNase family protein